MTAEQPEYLAEVRCMFCGCLWGYKPGFIEPGMETHMIGDCCKDWARENGWIERRVA